MTREPAAAGCSRRRSYAVATSRRRRSAAAARAAAAAAARARPAPCSGRWGTATRASARTARLVEVAVLAGHVALAQGSSLSRSPGVNEQRAMIGRLAPWRKGCGPRKTCSLRTIQNRAICSDFTRFGGSVASACNACRKLSTGMTRTGPAYLRASFALSPAGTRKTSTPARRTPIVFCFTPPIGQDGAVGLDLAGGRDLVAAGDVVAELLEHVEREREAGRRAADRARVDLHRDRQLRPGSPGGRRRRSPARSGTSCRVGGRLRRRTVRRGPRRADPEAHRVARLVRARSAGAGRRVVRTGLPSTATIDLGRLEPAFAAGEPGATSSTRAPSGLQLHLVAEVLQRDRARRCPASVPSPAGSPARAWLVADPGRVDLVGRDERLALVDEVEQLLEELGPADDDGVVVDAAGAGRVLPALDLDERRDRPGVVGQEEVVVGGDDPEDRRGRDQQDETCAEQASGVTEPERHAFRAGCA